MSSVTKVYSRDKHACMQASKIIETLGFQPYYRCKRKFVWERFRWEYVGKFGDINVK